MYEERFAARLSSLREAKNVSAREMSLSLGQNESYINRIENRKAFPSMQGFFYICEYLGISPRDFFDYDAPAPTAAGEVAASMRTLNKQQLDIISALIAQFTE